MDLNLTKKKSFVIFNIIFIDIFRTGLYFIFLNF